MGVVEEHVVRPCLTMHPSSQVTPCLPRAISRGIQNTQLTRPISELLLVLSVELLIIGDAIFLTYF
jgi:hypothetical protein